jgi:hypothetical protein
LRSIISFSSILRHFFYSVDFVLDNLIFIFFRSSRLHMLLAMSLSSAFYFDSFSLLRVSAVKLWVNCFLANGTFGSGDFSYFLKNLGAGGYFYATSPPSEAVSAHEFFFRGEGLANLDPLFGVNFLSILAVL